MRRTLLYDRETGELLHSHYEVRVVDDEGEARLSAPSAASLDAGMAELVSRGFDSERLGSLTTSVEPQSSRRTRRWVDAKSGRLRSRRLELTDDSATQEDR